MSAVLHLKPSRQEAEDWVEFGIAWWADEDNGIVGVNVSKWAQVETKDSALSGSRGSAILPSDFAMPPFPLTWEMIMQEYLSEVEG